MAINSDATDVFIQVVLMLGGITWVVWMVVLWFSGEPEPPPRPPVRKVMPLRPRRVAGTGFQEATLHALKKKEKSNDRSSEAA